MIKLVGGHEFDLGAKICRTCGRGIHFSRGNRQVKAHWAHNVDQAGLRWSRELRSRS